MRRPLRPRVAAAAALLVLAASLGGCFTVGGPHRHERPFVITNGEQLRDLYWLGALTDTRGNRWEVGLLPGVAPPARQGGRSMADAWDFANDLFEGPFWRDRGAEVRDGMGLAFDDSVRALLIEGIPADYAEANRRIARNMEERPFAWMTRIGLNGVWGYLVKPAGRLVLAPLGMALGIGYSATVPTVQVAGRPPAAAIWMVLSGVVTPALEITFQHLVFPLTLANREPDESHDGEFGMRIVERAAPEGEVEPDAAPAPEDGEG